MKNDLTCGVVRDLLPSYADGLTGNETNAAVARHMETCEGCRAALESMRTPTPVAVKNDEKEIAFLKKVKKKHLISALCCVLAAVLLVSGAFGALYLRRVKSSKLPVGRADVEAEVQVTNGSRVDLTLTLKDEAAFWYPDSDVKYDEETGRLTFTFYKTYARKGNAAPTTANWDSGQKIGSVYLDDVPLWENGVVISERVGRAFAAAHPYMGDITQNLTSAAALDIGRTFGSFTNEMTTSAQPYVWELTFEKPFGGDVSPETALIELTKDGVLLLATIGNLDGIVFRYTVKNADGQPEAHEISLSVEKADALTGQSVKEAGRTPSGLQALRDVQISVWHSY